jgi:hypothetical protein
MSQPPARSQRSFLHRKVISLSHRRAGPLHPPEAWLEGVFGLRGRQRFFDKQGAVHARVSVDFPREFGCLLEAPISSER